MTDNTEAQMRNKPTYAKCHVCKLQPTCEKVHGTSEAINCIAKVTPNDAQEQATKRWKARRKGTLQEFQNGRWFMYVTEWEEVSSGRTHREVEIYKNESVIVWNSTDPNQFEKAQEIFFDNPKLFESVDFEGALPQQ